VIRNKTGPRPGIEGLFSDFIRRVATRRYSLGDRMTLSNDELKRNSNSFDQSPERTRAARIIAAQFAVSLAVAFALVDLAGLAVQR
jgi:hypothetical protein